MEYICKYHKYGYCKLKDQCEKYHVNEECKEGSYCENIKICPLRHPKMCKRILMEEPCGFQETCAYNHKKRYNYQNTEIDTLHEEVKKLKVELDTLKSNFKSVFSVRAEIEFLQVSVTNMKELIQQLKLQI